jgi:hypothetical protein
MKTITASFKILTVDKQSIDQHLAYARTMAFMFKATKQRHYLTKARMCLDKARDIKVGFMRPLGALVNGVA